MLIPDDRAAVAEFAPALDRAVSLDPKSLARLRLGAEEATVLIRLPFGILVSRTVEVPRSEAAVDVTTRAAELLDWLQDENVQPEVRDLEWRAGRPPSGGWRRIETIPDSVLRPLVRSGALTLKQAAEREGVPGAQPRAEVADALLVSVVLTASDDRGSAEVTLRTVSALTRMGFLPRSGFAHVDVAGRWVRLVAEYGTVYLERPGQTLGLL
ncbi:MAG: hypothetical protein QOJ34_1457 [Pseudonocardiales bacterium]|nr:hypothetical protein [Pseudonocardiales bacterium]